jgi:signal transduction histidine kinase
MTTKINSKNSLNYQFKKQLFISIGLLVIVFSLLLHQLFFIGITTTMHRTMTSLAEHYGNQVVLDKNFPLPKTGNYRAYVGIEDIPQETLELFRQELITNKGLGLDNHRMLINDDGRSNDDSSRDENHQRSLFSPPKNVHFLIAQPLQNSAKKLYLIFSDSPQNKIRPPKNPSLLLDVPRSIFLITLFAIVIIYWVARRLINRVIKPLNELSAMANGLDENQPELSFDIMNDKTEIGQVAKTLHQTMGRIHQYHQREKQFLQNTSHELRTPIAVVKSALDIIDLRTAQGKSNVSDQHDYIRRANKNMAQITEALLLLSRKNSDQTPRENIDLNQLIQSAIEEHQYLLNNPLSKDTDEKVSVNFININKDDSVHLLPKALCQITLNNLIRNAFEHTPEGIVNIALDKTTITVTNTGTGLSDTFQQESLRGLSDGQGFGIGLDIVRQIAEQQGWLFEISSDKECRNQVIISFNEFNSSVHP